MEEKFDNLITDAFRNNPNNISYWYPKIKDCGILTPRTIIKQVPSNIVKCFWMDNQEQDIAEIRKWVETELLPEIPSDMVLLFVKNGTFSNKYNFTDCIPLRNSLDLTRSIININYTALNLGAGGVSEIAVRERIPFHKQIYPCIYNGMPLRTEFRIFYDFDNHKFLHAMNYWDKEYCHKNISKNMTDKIIYEYQYIALQYEYEMYKDEIISMVEKHMKEVDLQGIWSIDIMLDNKETWLIDMAMGNNST